MWAAVRENGDFFALAVRITGKLLKTDGYVHAATGLASTELSFHSCNVLRDCHRGVPRANKKMKAGVRKNDDFFQLWFEYLGNCCR